MGVKYENQIFDEIKKYNPNYVKKRTIIFHNGLQEINEKKAVLKLFD